MSVLSEKEAKTKWCPFARVGSSENALATPSNRNGKTLERNSFCISSACMAWRWSQKRNPDWKNPAMHGMSIPSRHPDDEPPMYIEDRERGYCGLAGRP